MSDTRGIRFVNVSGSRLNIRDKPNKSGARVGWLMPNAEIEIDPLYSSAADGLVWVKVFERDQYVAWGTAKHFAVVDEPYLVSMESRANMHVWPESGVVTQMMEVHRREVEP